MKRWLLLLLSIVSLGLAQAPRVPLVAVMPLAGQGVDEASSQVVTDALSDELLKTGKVRVMERSQMEKILKEQGFQQSGSCDGSECAVEVGKLLAIDKMVLGSVGKLGSSFTVSVRAVDVGSGEVLGSSRRMQRGEIDVVVSELLPDVAKELGGVLAGKSDAAASGAGDSTMAAVPAPVEPAAPAAAVEKERKSRWGWWLAGGVVVAGGVTAAVLLSQGSSGGSSWQTEVQW